MVKKQNHKFNWDEYRVCGARARQLYAEDEWKLTIFVSGNCRFWKRSGDGVDAARHGETRSTKHVQQVALLIEKTTF